MGQRDNSVPVKTDLRKSSSPAAACALTAWRSPFPLLPWFCRRRGTRGSAPERRYSASRGRSTGPAGVCGAGGLNWSTFILAKTAVPVLGFVCAFFKVVLPPLGPRSPGPYAFIYEPELLCPGLPGDQETPVNVGASGQPFATADQHKRAENITPRGLIGHGLLLPLTSNCSASCASSQ